MRVFNLERANSHLSTYLQGFGLVVNVNHFFQLLFSAHVPSYLVSRTRSSNPFVGFFSRTRKMKKTCKMAAERDLRRLLRDRPLSDIEYSHYYCVGSHAVSSKILS